MLSKPEKRRKLNRSSPEYRTRRAAFLARTEMHGGWWICECGRWTQEPELDHIIKTGMGGNPDRLLDEKNWALLCRNCHDKKDGGFRYT